MNNDYSPSPGFSYDVKYDEEPDDEHDASVVVEVDFGRRNGNK